ncbi:MAG: hypothetical protein FGM16_01360 [Flavobacterium sp.]|nr:hypothetical protein [Flavobacterium sp.]
MKKVLLLCFCLPFLTASTCEDSPQDDIFCTTEARAGLNVQVRLNSSSTFETTGISVIATEGSYVEPLEYYPGSTVFSGAYERQGTYIISVSKEGYIPFTSAPLTVTADECHVIPQTLEVNLIPQ